MARALFPGSFDPVTLGHLDLMERAARLFDELWIGVGANAQKTGLFTLDERVEILQQAVKGIGSGNLRVVQFDGLLAHFMGEHRIECLVRGLRNTTDFDYEYAMSNTNRVLNAVVETVFLLPRPEHSHLSSTLVREAARLGGNLEGMVPAAVLARLPQKLKGQQR